MVHRLLALSAFGGLVALALVAVLSLQQPRAVSNHGPGAVVMAGQKLTPKPQGKPTDWFWRQRAFPHPRIELAGYQLALREAAERQADATAARIAGGAHPLRDAVWQQNGPTNIGGRVTDLAIHPADADLCYAAMATGGVFRTTDAGASWTPIFDQGDVITVGDIALDPQNPDVIWVGTGEANAASLSFFGNGVYRSADAGATWQHLGLQDTRYIARVVVDPTDGDRVLVAATGQLFGTDQNRGVFRTLDGGQSWDRVFALTDSTACTDLALHPTNPDIVYAAMWERVRGITYRDSGGESSGIWRSLDGGDTWSELTVGLPSGPDVGRIGISVCASQPDVLYAVYDDASAYFEGVYKSTDGGDTWTGTSDGALSSIHSSFGWYFGQIRVNPVNANDVFVMGVPLYRTTNGGSSWFEEGANMHVDHHALEFAPSQPQRAYAGNDGGLYRSDDGGYTWIELDDQPTNQFYAIGFDFLQPHRLYGGTQDNGTLRTPDGSTGGWERIFGGDGFVTLVDYTDSDVIYCEYQYGNLYKSSNDGLSFSWAMNGIASGDRHNWHTPVVMDPANPEVLYYGSQRVYKTVDGAANWSAISGDLTDGDQGANFGTITSIAVAPSAPSIVYAGTDDGNLWAYRPFNGQWAAIDAGLPKRWITDIAVHPTQPSTLWVTFSGLRWNEPISHVYRSDDGGATWTDVSGDLPETPVSTVLVDPDFPDVLYVGTDVGVYFSQDGGAHWHVVGSGLPRAPVLDLKFHQPTRTLAAGTHGRSIFTVTAPDVTTPVQDVPAPAVLALAAAPNPFNPMTTLRFSAARAGRAVVEIYDVRGGLVAVPWRGDVAAGEQAVRWDGRDHDGRALPSGIYVARVTVGGAVGTAKLALAR